MRYGIDIKFGSLMLILFSTGAFIFSGVSLWYALHTSRIVTVDLNSTITHYVTQLQGLSLDSKSIHSKTHHFNQALQASLNQYAKTHSVVILVKPSVIQGASDITPEIQMRVAHLMQRIESAKMHSNGIAEHPMGWRE